MTDNQKTPQEIAREILSKSKQKDAKAKVRLTRYIFLLLIVFQTLGVFVAFKTFPNASMTSFFIDFGLIGAYVVLFLTSYKLPFQSFLLGLGLFCSQFVFSNDKYRLPIKRACYQNNYFHITFFRLALCMANKENKNEK
jgi:hypothetical protein